MPVLLKVADDILGIGAGAGGKNGDTVFDGRVRQNWYVVIFPPKVRKWWVVRGELLIIRHWRMLNERFLGVKFSNASKEC